MNAINIVNYSQTGHYMYPEDTWDDTCTFKNEKELLNACKEWYKMSARGFNNYPFISEFSFNNLTFEKQNIIIVDDEVFNGKLQACGAPEYFDNVKFQFNEWLDNIKVRLPKLRVARDKRLQEEHELDLYKKLSIKYKNKN